MDASGKPPLNPGDYFTIKDNKTIFKCMKVIMLEDEALSWIRAMEMEGPRGKRTERMFRALLLSEVDQILEGEQ
jgi:hypothetical protein